ncbi:HBS1-like protein [Argiope bruennichi]|uniref:HBS1-like protein like n=1 Tax=Argiope bruennichi TaxID=94029 RepID=A0A8T0FZI9_ARGBR|nr:HBS1-like protein [Argiope bruennichi]KAF8796514.1 HBS1-like protein like [Argiope bruennichi]
MARHRNVRAIDADEEYEDYHSCYGHSVEDDFCASPSTEAQFLYNRNTRSQNMNAFFGSPEPVPEEENSGDESFNNSDSTNHLISGLSDVDNAKLQSCVLALQDVVGDTIPEIILQQAAIDHNFDLEKALNAVLQEKAPKPQRGKKPKPATTPSANAIPKNKSEIRLESVSDGTNKADKLVTSKAKEVQRKEITTTDNSNTFDKKEPEEKCSKGDSIGKEKDKSPVPSSATETQTTNGKTDEESKSTTVKSAKNEKSGKEIFSAERGDVKPLINLVVIGHVDAGKSTLMGHLLYDLGIVSQRNMHKFEKESKKLGKSSFMYAWVLDETPEERNRGITMDVAFSTFETPNRSVTLLDAPGHKDFIPNMITGAAQADVAILVVDSNRGEFETGFEAGGQTREHTMLIRSLGVTELAIAVNKMDSIGWAEERFQEIKAKMSSFLKQVGFRESDVKFVPCSGLTGENLVKNPDVPELKNWYSGPTLLEIIDNFKPPERLVDKPFRMCVGDVFKGATGGFCAAGKIEAGFVKNGDKVLAMPAGEQAIVKAISADERSLTYGFAGDHVMLQLSGVDFNNISTGSMLCSIDKPVKVTSRFEARLVIFNISVPITKGFPVILHYQSLSEQAYVKKLISQLNRSTGEVVRNKPRCLTKNSSAVVEIEVNRPICIELFKEFKDLGRFMLRSGGSTIAAGLVTNIS